MGESVNTTPVAVIVLAAGAGTRMKSDTPKMLHQIGGRSLLSHSLYAAKGLDPDHLVVVVGWVHGDGRRHQCRRSSFVLVDA